MVFLLIFGYGSEWTWGRTLFIYLFLKDFIYLFLGREDGRGKEGKKDQCVVASLVALTGDLACSPGMCPDWESN